MTGIMLVGVSSINITNTTTNYNTQNGLYCDDCNKHSGESIIINNLECRIKN